MSDKLLDFVGKRKENIEQKRRSFERILFQNFLGAYTVLDNQGTNYPVSLVDISQDGCLFQVPLPPKAANPFEKDTEVTLRMYFTKQTFIPVVVRIKYGNEVLGTDGNHYMAYGCEFDKSLPSFAALQSFIDFLYSYSEHSALDRGDSRSYFL